MGIHRLSEDIGDATEPFDIRIPVEGELMLSDIPAEFELSSSEATQKFKQKLNSELDELQKWAVLFPFTFELIQKDEIKIPVEGALMLSRLPEEYGFSSSVEGALKLSSVPEEYGFSSAAETEQFIQNLLDELEWVLSLDKQFPLTFQFIQRVIGLAERYMIEKASI